MASTVIAHRSIESDWCEDGLIHL